MRGLYEAKLSQWLSFGEFQDRGFSVAQRAQLAGRQKRDHVSKPGYDTNRSRFFQSGVGSFAIAIDMHAMYAL